MASEPEHRIDPESFLEGFRKDSEQIGFGTPPPEVELERWLP